MHALQDLREGQHDKLRRFSADAHQSLDTTGRVEAA